MSTRTKTTTVTETRTLARKPMKVGLQPQEEQVLRMLKGVAVDANQPLEQKSKDPEVLAKLRDIEARLFIEAGRLESVSKKQRIIDKLKNR